MEKRVKWIAKKEIKQGRVDKYLEKSIEMNKMTNGGPCMEILEKRLREILEINEDKDIILVNNGCSALHSLVSGINMVKNKTIKYITQNYTFPVSVQGCLRDSKIIDIDNGGGLDLNKINNEINNEIEGIIVTNCFGNVVDISKYIQWAKKQNKILLFDNAACPYTFYDGINSVNFGTGSIISFHHTKPLGFGEGGAIIVDKIYSHAIKCIINFGYDTVSMTQQWHTYGSNYKMSDISAAYILQYLDDFSHIVQVHHSLYNYFIAKLSTLVLSFPSSPILFPNFSSSTPFLSCFPLLFPFPVDLSSFSNFPFETRKYYKPLDIDLPGFSHHLWSHIICFPCHHDMLFSDIDDIFDFISIILSQS